MTEIIDRRENPRHKSAVNAQRFTKRYKEMVREAVADAAGKGKIADIGKDGSVSIPAKGIHEPTFRHGKGGRRDIVLPGNKEYVTGDQIKRPEGGDGGGSQASKDGEGEDAFRFRLSREEFLDYFLADLKLPDMVRKSLGGIEDYKRVRAGYRADGTPSNLSLVRTMRQQLQRHIAFGATARKRRLEALEAELRMMLGDELARAVMETADPEDFLRLISEHEILQVSITAIELCAEYLALRALIAKKRIPYLDNFDLRYKDFTREPIPIAQAVMVCVMDVSGSMDESRKDLAKRFFILLHLFLRRHYERVAIEFVRYHTIAKRVDEEEFFHGTDTGGTVISNGLRLTNEIITAEYPPEKWNSYIALASDGDNYSGDDTVCMEILGKTLLPKVQYFAYAETATNPQSFWHACESLQRHWKKLAMGRLREKGDIFPLMREFFGPKTEAAQGGRV